MRIEIDDPAGIPPTSLEALPVSIGIERQGPYAQPLEEKAFLNGQPLTERRALVHGDVLQVGDLYIFVLTDGSSVRLQIDRQPGAITAPPLLEPDEPEEPLEADEEVQSIHRAPSRPLLRGRAARTRSSRPRRWTLLAFLIALAAVLWVQKSILRVPEPAPPVEETKVQQPEPPPPTPPVSEPQPVAGKLLVRTKPAGADVTVAGLYRGRTPLQVELQPAAKQTSESATEQAAPDEYPVEIHRAGYEPANRTVTVKTGESVALEVNLKPILGQVTVRGEPADAQLFVDGEAKGAAGQTLSLPAATLQLEVRRDGYQTFAISVTPQPGFPRVIEYKLLTPEQVQAERYPPVIKTKTGIELRLMPTGRFEMGSARREAGSRANESRRNVTLQRRFYLGTKEITNAEYLRFRTEHLSGVIKDRSLDQDNHPVVNVTWVDAVDFCNWLSAQEGLPAAYEQQGENRVLVSPATTGYRLPTEAEWEWAARYERGQAVRRYPWGRDLPVPAASGNYADRSSLAVVEAALEGYDDGFPTTAPVGRFPAGPLGLFDIGGNASEWMHDFYTVYRELDQGSTTDPTGPASGTNHVIRGSNWKTASVTELRSAWRDSYVGKAQHIGFRIARYAE